MITLVGAAPSGEVTRERVLRLADSLFAEHGYAAVSMRELAAAAGVTKPALYYHFRDKEALFEECVAGSHLRLGEQLTDAAQGMGSLADRLERVAHVLLTGTSHHPVRTQADIAEHLPFEARRRLGAHWQEHVMGPVIALFRKAQAGGELREVLTPEDAAAALMGVTMSFWRPMEGRDGMGWGTTRPHFGGSSTLDPDDAARTIADLVTRGVARG